MRFGVKKSLFNYSHLSDGMQSYFDFTMDFDSYSTYFVFISLNFDFIFLNVKYRAAVIAPEIIPIKKSTPMDIIADRFSVK